MPLLRKLLRPLLKTKIKVLVVIGLLLVVAVFLFFYLQELTVQTYSDIGNGIIPIDHGGHPIILWWTPFTGDNGSVKKCGSLECFFTNNRKYFSQNDLQALLFYGSNLIPEDMPSFWSPVDKSRPLWCLLHEESAKNVALLQHSAALSLFNLSATFSRHSHFPLTLQHISGKEAITSSEYFVPTSMKNKLRETLAPVVFVQSDCDTPSERDSYVSELMKYIPIDSYGICLNNKKLPEHLQDAMEGMHHDDFWRLLSKYKFTIAFENAVCEDYITEKLWRPLILGTIPIYYGSPTVEDWLPNNKSVIKIQDFNSPQDLAKYILQLDEDDNLYETYLQHKIKNKYIANKKLVSSLDARTWSTDSEDYNSKNFVEEFECFVCRNVHDLLYRLQEGREQWQVTQDHYKCPPPVSPLTLQENRNNWWLEQWYQGKSEAKVLHRLIMTNKTFTKQHFYDEVGKCMLAKEKCL